MKPWDKKKVAWLSVTSNTLLTGGKLAAGLMSGSVSILSEAAHSAMDLVAAIIATFSVHVSDRPADEDHQYGHHKVENVSGVIEGMLIFAAAGWIIYEALHKLVAGSELKHLGPGVIVMGFSAAMNLAVATMLKRSAVASRSVALEADAAHLYTDVYTSAGVLLGLAGIWAGDYFFGVKLVWLDPAIALAVALLILHAATDITLKSFRPLMDMAASPEEVKAVEESLQGFRARGCDFHKVRTRDAGGIIHVDLHMRCRPEFTLTQAHALSGALKADIRQKLPGTSVLIHIEPCDEECDQCRAECPERHPST